jgi:dolichol-phosphate mannosyltransferase
VRSQRDDPRLRRLASALANAVRSAALGDACPDSACGLKLFPRQALLELPFFEGMHRFLPALFRLHGYAVRSVPVRGRARFAGRSKYGAVVARGLTTLADLLGVLWLRRRMRVPEVEGNAPGAAAFGDRPAQDAKTTPNGR